MAAAPNLAAQILTFSVGDRHLGIPALLVQEIISMPKITRVPYAPQALLGVANMRGTVIPVISVARLIGQDEADARRIIVVKADAPVGLAVTSVSQVVSEDKADGISLIDIAALVAQAVPEKRQRQASSHVMAITARAQQTKLIALGAFSVSGQDFALPLASIEQIIRLPDHIALMPHSDSVVIGNMALQGAVLPLLSLAAMLALPVCAADRQTRIVVVKIGTHRVGLLVDAMQAVVRVAEEDIDPVPQVLNRGEAEVRIQAICRLDRGTRLLSVLATDQLLRDDITARLLKGDTGEQPDMTLSATTERSERFLLFRIGDEHFGLPIDAVEEVAPLPPRLTPLPKAPDFVRGVMNLRGQVIPVIDQAQRFNGTKVASAKPRVIVVRIDDLTAGFIVDAVSEVANVPESAIREAPDLGTEGTRVFDRVATFGDHRSLALIISPRELLDRAERDLLAKIGKKGAAEAQ